MSIEKNNFFIHILFYKNTPLIYTTKREREIDKIYVYFPENLTQNFTYEKYIFIHI